jgi:hypothetical protein
MNSTPVASQRLKPLLEIRPGRTAEFDSYISQAPIFSRSAALVPEFTDWGQPAEKGRKGEREKGRKGEKGKWGRAESTSSISQARIFSRSAASMPEFTARGQPAVETAAGNTSGTDGRI